MSDLPKSSKSLDDAHPMLRDAYPLVLTEFLKVHPDMDLKVDYTYRSPGLQTELYMKGRALENGYWVVIDKNQIVTDKNGTDKKSQHNFYPSRAADVYIMRRDGKIIWPNNDDAEICALYKELGALWVAQGLISGALWEFKWKDWDHVQVPASVA